MFDYRTLSAYEINENGIENPVSNNTVLHMMMLSRSPPVVSHHPSNVMRRQLAAGWMGWGTGNSTHSNGPCGLFMHRTHRREWVFSLCG